MSCEVLTALTYYLVGAQVAEADVFLSRAERDTVVDIVVCPFRPVHVVAVLVGKIIVSTRQSTLNGPLGMDEGMTYTVPIIGTCSKRTAEADTLSATSASAVVRRANIR